jgi:TetR/AcrR family transcriptional regulator, lmrAB and yxaGH operons repressor
MGAFCYHVEMPVHVPAPNSDAAQPSADTRERIVLAGMRLFRKQGYHGTGLADILAAANTPKGSLYHHFPNGKQAIGVAVIEALAQGMLGMIEHSKARSTAGLVADIGEQLAATMERTQHELCALFSGFVAERRTQPELGQAVADAYRLLAEAFAKRLQRDGFAPKLAAQTSQTVVMLLEGGAVIAQAQQQTAPFLLALKQAQLLCKLAKN